MIMIEVIAITIAGLPRTIAPLTIMDHLIIVHQNMTTVIIVLDIMVLLITVPPITAHHDMNRARIARIIVAPVPVRMVDIPTQAHHAAILPTIVPRIEIAE